MPVHFVEEILVFDGAVTGMLEEKTLLALRKGFGCTREGMGDCLSETHDPTVGNTRLKRWQKMECLLNV